VAGVLIAAGGLATAWVIAWGQSFVLPVPEAFLEATEELLVIDSAGRLAWLLLLVAVTPAICEELVFRGVLLGASRDSLTPVRAVLLNALLFGAFHLSFETVFRLAPTAWLGALLAVTVWRTRSIWVGMMMHFLNNGSIVVMGAIPALREPLSDPESAPPAAVIAIGAGALASGLWLLFRATRTPRRSAVSPSVGSDPAPPLR